MIIMSSFQVECQKTTMQEDESIFPDSPLIKSFMAGAFSGTCSTILFQPLDLVKTRLQKSVSLGRRLGLMNEVAKVVKQERVIGLWKGLMPSMYRCVPGIGLYFTNLHWLKATFGTENPSCLESLLIGASARSIAGIMVLPFTVVKTRFESGEFNYTSVRQAMRLMYATEGFRGMYCGLAATLMRDVPFSSLYLMFYTKLKAFSADLEINNVMAVNFSNGIAAGLLASLLTQPADVIKTNMQLYPKQFGSLKLAVVHIYGKSGIQGFMRGLVPRVVRRSLMSALAWTVYEELMRAFKIKT